MPTHRYDRYFGGAPGAAEKALAKMRKTYGRTAGEQVFYGTVAKRERKEKSRTPRRKSTRK